MPTRLAVEKLRRDLETMGEMCEFAIASAIMSLVERDADMAFYIMEYDRDIDEVELAVDTDCINLIREGQLSEDDLRFVISAQKINGGLERVGDLASSICEHVLFLVREKSVLSKIFDFSSLLEQVNMMMRESVEALLSGETGLAWKIIDERGLVDEEVQVIFQEILEVMKSDSRTVERCCHVLQILKNLHRVADQASNIAEEIIYRREGVVVRHHIRELHPVMPKPFGDVAGEEEEKLESLAARDRLDREEARKMAKRKTKKLAVEKIEAGAAAAKDKAKKARADLIRQRAEARKK